MCIASDNGTAYCVCKPEYSGVGCEAETTQGSLDEYVRGWNPIGTIILGIVGAAIIVFVGGFAYNFAKGKRGLNCVPGIQQARSKVGGDEYKAIGGPDQRNASNY